MIKYLSMSFEACNFGLLYLGHLFNVNCKLLIQTPLNTRKQSNRPIDLCLQPCPITHAHDILFVLFIFYFLFLKICLQFDHVPGSK